MYQEETCTATMFEEIKKDNPKAFAFFFELHYNSLCYFAERLIRDPLVAEDLVEETFMKLWAKRLDFENEHGIKAFLYITTKNACINSLKRSRRDSASQAEMLYLAEKKEGFVLNEMIKAEVLNVVSLELDSLPLQCQTILKLCYVRGLKNQEIAAKLDISIQTVKNQKARGMQILRSKFEASHILR